MRYLTFVRRRLTHSLASVLVSVLLAASPAAAVVINEIMQNPAAVSDSAGEWFELHNPSASPVDVNGWTVKDDDVDRHVIAQGGPLVIPPGGFLVLARNGDPGVNGGIAADYDYSGLVLANGADELVLLDTTLREIDRVAWDDGAHFPDPIGASMELARMQQSENHVGAYWFAARTLFGDGDRGTPGRANRCPGELQIHYIDVQQGTATLVIGFDGTSILMDAGKNGKGTGEILPYLEQIGMRPEDGLDYTLASHLDYDHIGGFDEVIGNGSERFDVRVANWYNGSPKTGTTITGYKQAVAATTAKGPDAVPVGAAIDLGDGARLTVVACNGDVRDFGPVSGATNENDRSVAVLIQYGYFDYIWAGDLGGGDDDEWCTYRDTSQKNLETPLAHALVNGGDPMLTREGVEVLHVSHHGSDSSTNSDWMNLLRPEVAVITVGNNGYGHPHATVVEGVLNAEATACVTAPSAGLVLQTGEGDLGHSELSMEGYVVGDIQIRTDGSRYSIDAPNEPFPDERADAGLPVQFMVDEVVFSDGFETGNTSAWGTTIT